MTPTITWTNGLTFGIEHLTSPEDMEDDIVYMIVIHLFLFKICLLKFT